MPTYVLPERLRSTLRQPIGDLIPGSDVDLGRVLQAITEKGKPAKLILVGDSVSRRASQAGIRADVTIIDNLEQRRQATKYAHPRSRSISAKNRAGMIEQNAQLAVERAIRGEADLVDIDGEEDLLAIIAVIAAPLGSLVVYGQSNQGVVLVPVSKESKAVAERILGEMKRLGDG